MALKSPTPIGLELLISYWRSQPVITPSPFMFKKGTVSPHEHIVQYLERKNPLSANKHNMLPDLNTKSLPITTYFLPAL